MPKTKKALFKRIKTTGSGKKFRRSTRQNHFNAKDSSDTSRRKRINLPLNKVNSRIVKSWLI